MHLPGDESQLDFLLSRHMHDGVVLQGYSRNTKVAKSKLWDRNWGSHLDLCAFGGLQH